MSRTKDYIDSMMEEGIDVLAIENPYDDEAYFEKKYRESLQEMIEFFTPEITE